MRVKDYCFHKKPIISQEEISVVQEIKVYVLKAYALKAEENSTSQVTSL